MRYPNKNLGEKLMIKTIKYLILIIAVSMQFTACKEVPVTSNTEKNMLMGTWYSKKPVNILGDSYSFKKLTFSKNNAGKYIINMKTKDGKSDDIHLDLFYEYRGDTIYYLSSLVANAYVKHENHSRDELLKYCQTMKVIELSKDKLIVTYYKTLMVLHRK